MPILTKFQGDIADAMRRWDPINFTQTKDCNNSKLWESFEQNGLKTKFFKHDEFVSMKKNNETIENNALMLEDIADPFRTLKHKLGIKVK